MRDHRGRRQLQDAKPAPQVRVSVTIDVDDDQLANDVSRSCVVDSQYHVTSSPRNSITGESIGNRRESLGRRPMTSSDDDDVIT